VILVIGATGKVGRQLLDELTDAGVRVRAVVRDATLPSRADQPGLTIMRAVIATSAAVPVTMKSTA
jgi:uncharacterized protein YbjT (DUF2867 family)